MRRLPVALLAVLASLTFLVATVIAAGASSPTLPAATWTRLSPATSPPARDSASMAYDPATGNIVLFGGANGGSDLSDTWIFDGATWTRLSPATSPPARSYASLAYDPATGNMVLFGGSGASSDLADTWTFNGTTWTRLSPATSPPARDSASMAYDPATGNMVLFGGEDNSANLADTWTFNGTTWTRLSPATSPPARWYASMAYDPASGDILLFGGSASSGDLSDTWTFDGTTWTQLSPATSPPARDSASMAYDPAEADIVLFGGSTSSGDLSDTWTFDGTAWTQLSPATSPPARDSASMAYDQVTGDIVLFGGEDNSANLSDTWTFVQSTVTLTQGSPISALVAYGAGYSGHSLAVTNSTRTVSYSEVTSADSTDVVVSGTGAISAATSLAPGIYTVAGSDRDANDDTGTWTFSLIVGKASQSITFTSTAPSNATVGTTYTVIATGGASGNAVTFSTMSACTVSGSTVSFIGVGPCVIDADQAGNADYLMATQVQQTIAVGKASQSISFTSTAPSNATVGATYTVTAKGGASGNAVTFHASSTCAVSGSEVRFIGVGECVIEADQAGNADFFAATEVQQTITVGKGSQTITFTSGAPSDATVGATYTVTATGGASGNAVTFSTTSMCTVSGSKVSFIGV
ncbi:MAG: kelch repeat-containing protein, partial [Acidimicrobiales bacterium]